MIYLLDTNACIVYLNGRKINLRRQLECQIDSDIVVCSIVKAELFYGAKRSNKPTKNLTLQRAFLSSFISLPFDDTAAQIFGDIRAKLTNLGTLIGPYDLQIAAIALANNRRRARRCIGSAFALYQMQIVLGTILARHELTLSNQRPVTPSRLGFAISRKCGVKMVYQGSV